MIVSNNSSYNYTNRSIEHSKHEQHSAPTQHTGPKDQYESSVGKQQYGSYSAPKAKMNTPASVAHKLDLDETGVPKTYHPSWPTELRKSFWDHDKNLTLMEQTRAPSFRIATEMSVFNSSPDNYPSDLSDKDKFLAMIEDIKIKWEKHLTASSLPKDEKEMYAKALKDVDVITQRANTSVS